MKNKKKVKVNRYRLGTQQVAVPDKGGLDTVASPTLSMAATGASVGSMFGPIGTGVGAAAGAVAGFTKGMVDKSSMNRANKMATNQNKYNQLNDRVEDPHLMQMQEFGKGSRYVKAKYPSGTKSIQPSYEEVKAKQALLIERNNATPRYIPNTYKSSIGGKYPGGTSGVKTAKQLSEESRQKRAAKYGNTNKAAELNNEAIILGKNEHGLPAGDQEHKKSTKKGPPRFRADNEYPDGTQAIKLTPEELETLNTARNNTTDSNAYRNTLWSMMGYTPKKYPAGSDGWKQQEEKFNTAVDYINQGFRPNSTGNGYKKIYEEGTKEIEVEKDELIFSKKGNKYLLRADFKGGKTHAQGGEDYVAEEGDIIFPGKQRKKVLNAYKRGDTSTLEAMRMNLPKDMPNKAQYGLDNTDTYLPAVNAQEFNLDNMDFSTNTSNLQDNVVRGGFGDYTESNMPSNSGVSTFGTNSTTGTQKGAGMAGAINTGMELAPIIYNTFRGLSKPTKVQRNYYNPEKYQYTDISNPARRAAQEAYNVDKYNVNTTRGSRGQIQSYLQSASNNKYKRLADIGNFEGGRKMDVFNRNTELSNQAGLTNLQLSNQYNDIDAQNRGKRNDFLASATGQVSQFAQKRNIEDQMRQRDEKLMAMDQQRLNLYGSMYNNYTPDYTTDVNGNVNFSGIKYRQNLGNYNNPKTKYRTKKESRTGFVKP